MSKTAKLTPNLDENSTKALNLTVLQRTDPSVEEILQTATHVTLYKFDIDSCEWSRKDVEGSLFVVKRNSLPRFQFIVMNRLSTDNMVEHLLGDFEYELQVPYLLYRNASQEVNGIWFYSSHECEEIANLFGRIIKSYPKVPAQLTASPTSSGFEDLEAVPSTQAVMGDNVIELSSAATSNASDVPNDQSFLNFLNAAMNIGSAPNSAISGQPHHPSTTVISAFPQMVTPQALPSAPMPVSLSDSATILSLLKKTESNTAVKCSTDLVTPSTFFTPTSSSPLIIPPTTSSIPTAPPTNLQGSPQEPYGGTILQPFPPPTLKSVTPTSAPAHVPVVSREKVGEALQMLVQDTQFIEMVYQAMLKVHQHHSY